MAFSRYVPTDGNYEIRQQPHKDSDFGNYEEELMRQRALTRPIHSEQQWKAGCAECHDCHELVPHKLLYVCRHPRCHGFSAENENTTYSTPFEFYANEKVYCSNCSFMGKHRHHHHKMKESHPLATALASQDKEFQKQFERLAFLDHEDPVDFMITSEFHVEQLPVLAAQKYLLSAGDTTEWSNRKKELEDFKATVEQCRLEGNKCARELAEKSLNFYNELVQSVEDTLEKDDEREAKIAAAEQKKKKERRSEESGGRTSRSSKPSNSENILVDNSAASSSSIKEEDPETPKATVSSTVLAAPQQRNEIDESTARMICRSLSLHYDQVRDGMSIEHALQNVSDKLHELYGSTENKKAAAKMFKEKHNLALYYLKEE